jgi:hypothetical protein
MERRPINNSSCPWTRLPSLGSLAREKLECKWIVWSKPGVVRRWPTRLQKVQWITVQHKGKKTGRSNKMHRLKSCPLVWFHSVITMDKCLKWKGCMDASRPLVCETRAWSIIKLIRLVKWEKVLQAFGQTPARNKVANRSVFCRRKCPP